MKSNQLSKILINISIYLFFTIGVAALAYAILQFFLPFWTCETCQNKYELASQIGDFTGGAVGISWTIVSVLLLIKTLNAQKDEFKSTQIAIQNQQFESSFFQLMGQLQVVREGIKGKVNSNNNSIEMQGIHLISEVKQGLHEFVNSRLQAESEKNNPQIISILSLSSNSLDKLNYTIFLRDQFDEFFKQHHTLLGHYFRLLINIIKFVIDSKTSVALDEAKNTSEVKRYLYLLQAGLSNEEFAILFYYSLSNTANIYHEKDDLKTNLEKYEFFKYIDKKALIAPSHHYLYPATYFHFLTPEQIKERTEHFSKIE